MVGGAKSSNFLIDTSTAINDAALTVNDANRYIWTPASGWGTYWDTGTNTYGWYGSGIERARLDLDNGNLQTDGTLSVGGTGNFTGTVTVGTPTADSHATNRSWVQSYVAGSSGIGGIGSTYVNQTGDTMSGTLNMGNNAITGINWSGSDDGSGSGLDADLLDGYHLSTTRNSANTVPVRNSSGYLDLGWINTTSGSAGTTNPDRIYASYDGYIRYYTPANFAGVMKSNTLTALKTVDGSGSGLDADTIDGHNYSTNWETTGDITGITNGTGITGGCTSGTCTLNATLGTQITEGEIAQNTLDDSEIQDNSLTAGSLAANSVGNSELIDSPTFTSITSGTGNFSGTVTAMDFTSAGGKNIVVGDDAYLTDVDVANTLGVYGNQNSDRAGIRLGYDGGYIFGDNGNIGIGTTNPQAKLDVNGGLKLGNDTDTCNSTKAGTIRWTGTNFEACNGSVWATLNLWSCGSKVYDIQGNTYNTVQIGTQCWMSENMRTTKYPDGSNITKGPSAQGSSGWNTDNAWYSCPPNTSNNGEDCSAAESLGMLYQWSAMMNGSTAEGAQGICPTGWHIPTDAEQYTLENYLNEGTCTVSRDGTWGCNPSGSKLAGNDAIDQNWNSGTLTNHADFDTSGFNAPAVGDRNINGGDYNSRASYCHFWASSGTGTSAWNRVLSCTRSDVYRVSYPKAYGFSARCIKD